MQDTRKRTKIDKISQGLKRKKATFFLTPGDSGGEIHWCSDAAGLRAAGTGGEGERGEIEGGLTGGAGGRKRRWWTEAAALVRVAAVDGSGGAGAGGGGGLKRWRWWGLAAPVGV